jgi:glutathione reductase (NADPH)
MAIAAGRRLGDRLTGGMPTAKADYSNVPTVVFSHPVIGTIGLSEEAARKEYSGQKIKVYNSTFVNLWYGTYFKGGPGNKPMSKYKLVCVGDDERVVGLHCIGAQLLLSVIHRSNFC